MSRPQGAKNKPKKILTLGSIKPIETPEVTSKWLTISRKELMRKIHTGEIPSDCFFKSGNRYKIITNKVADFFGIKPVA